LEFPADSRAESACYLVLGADGSVEDITSTTNHPEWSVDRQEWVPLAELGERALMGQGLEDAVAWLLVLARNPVRWTCRGEFSKRDRAAIDHRRSVFQSEFRKHIDARAAGDAFAEADR